MKTVSLKILISLLFIFLVIPSSYAMFIQPDPTIPQLYNPQSLNRYSYTLNNPYKYVDPTGNEPTVAELTTPDKTVALIEEIEQNNPELTAQEVLSVVAAQYPAAFGDSDSVEAEGEYSEFAENRFVYTEEKGFIDQSHFFHSADDPYSSPITGYGIEIVQLIPWVGQQSSSFSYEDLPSNMQGASFGRNLNSN
mgnify:CR=1 FL=1